ncbi:MAG: hypothetical protein Fur0046_20790 [Cyanobacteria bacterium J069]
MKPVEPDAAGFSSLTPDPWNLLPSITAFKFNSTQPLYCLFSSFSLSLRRASQTQKLNLNSTPIDVIKLPVLPDGKISVFELGAVESDETDYSKQRFYLRSERVNLAVNLPGKLADEVLLKA